MGTRVLLLGRRGIAIDAVRTQLDLKDVELLAGTGIEDVRTAFAEGPIDHVIMGAGIDLGTRLEIVRHVFETSATTTVHMKDRDSGPQGMIPFVGRVLSGLAA